jgi:hypothetical protein
MAKAHPAPTTPDELAAVGVAYVEFALRRPALFQVMFGEPCDRENSERVAATEAIWDLVSGGVRAAFPDADTEAMGNAVWSLTHGLAFLHLDGKFDASEPAAVSNRVLAAIRAILTSSYESSRT